MRFSGSICAGFCCLLPALASSACSSTHDHVEKQLSALQTEVARLQSHGDRLEARLEALELKRGEESSRPVAESTTPSVATIERPRLMVVKLEPGEDASLAEVEDSTASLRPEDSAADQSPRPLIRVHGTSTGDVADARRKR